jgi:hypothetical protein
MFRWLIGDYRRQAGQQISDAEDLESGGWHMGDRDGDQSGVFAASKRALAARLSALANAYERLDRK